MVLSGYYGGIFDEVCDHEKSLWGLRWVFIKVWGMKNNNP